MNFIDIIRFGASGVTDFDKGDELPEFRGVNHCEYFMKIIPHKFVQGSSVINDETFQYSMHYQCKDSVGEKEEGHQLSFMHELSSIGIKYTKEEISLLQTLTSVMAIVGGVYVIMGILHRGISKFITI